MVGDVHRRDVRRSLVPGVFAANLVAAALTAAAIELSEPAREPLSIGVRLAGSIGGTLALASCFALVIVRRWQKREPEVLGWLDEGRLPSLVERDRVLGEPWREAKELFRYWLLASLVVGVTFLVTDGMSRTVPAGTAATLLGSITATTLTLFLAERAMRPALVVALAGEPPKHPVNLGVRRRIVLAWALGSGIPLAWIALVPVFRHPASDVSIAVLTTLLAIGGIAAGASIAYLVGGSVGGPVEAVRRGLAVVERGELNVSVRVDDAGELGLLEAGFNNMVTGLAERQRLQDLFGRHVGEEVATRALERGVELGGEVRDVSVLFVDLVGSTKLATQRPPTEVVGLLNQFFAAVVSAAAAEGGWVNKFEGDAALCIFGAPEPQADHAARALRAARSLRTELCDIDAAISVSAGDAVAGNVGTEARYEYTVIGHPVNEAARLVEEAKRRDSRLVASGAVVERADTEALAWVAVGQLQLRGIPHPVKVYEPVASAAGRE